MKCEICTHNIHYSKSLNLTIICKCNFIIFAYNNSIFISFIIKKTNTMKLKLLLLFSLAFLGVAAQETSSTNFSNLDKGHISFGLSSNSLGMSRSSLSWGSNSSTTKMTTINLGFDAGYFVMKSLQVGIYSGIDLSNYKDVSNMKHFGFGTKINYYFTSGSQFAPFVSVSGGYIRDNFFGFETNGYAWRLGPGLSYFANKNIAIQALLQYEAKSFDISTIDDRYADPSIDITKHFTMALLNINFGFSIFL